MTTLTNRAAWLVDAKAIPLEVKPAPIATPSENQILVKHHAIAINPIEGKLQRLAFLPLNYPIILGSDIAGEVIEVGSNVTHLKKGDRVLGMAAGFDSKLSTEAAFQEYSLLRTNLACKIPDSITYERAALVPVGTATAAAGLFQEDFLNLQLPTEPAQQSTGKTVLIWGGASSVGCNAIQLAVAAGYEVFTTASPKNFAFVKKLGASQVFDYKSPNVVDDIVAALKQKVHAGTFDAFGNSAGTSCVEIVQKLEGGQKFIATVIDGFPDPPEGIRIRQLFSLTIGHNHVGNAIFGDFIPKALAAGTYVPAPEPVIVGHGVESIQKGIDVQANGVSAQKIVVTL